MIDWFFSGTERIVQSVFWKSILANFEWIDWATSLVIILGLLYGIKKGFLRELVEIAEAVVILFLVYSYYKKTAFFMGENFGFIPPGFEPAAAFTVLAVPLWITASFADGRLSQLFHTKTAGPIHVIGGALLGCFHLFLLWSFISQPIILMPVQRIRRVYEDGNSYTGPAVRKLAPRIYSTLTQAGRLAKEDSGLKGHG